MYGLTRASLTLIGAGVAGFLIWLATHLVGDKIDTNGDYWVTVLLLAAAGLVIALSQLLGGWTKWGWPRVSAHVLLFAFVPALIAAGWVIVASQPDPNSARDHVTGWSSDIGIHGLVTDLTRTWQAVAVLLGLVAGLTLDTTGPRLRRTVVEENVPAPEPPATDEPAPPPP
jgi:hypothetical protein